MYIAPTKLGSLLEALKPLVGSPMRKDRVGYPVKSAAVIDHVNNVVAESVILQVYQVGATIEQVLG